MLHIMSRKNPRALPRLDHSKIKEFDLDCETLAAIGRIILLCAQVDDLVTEAIFRASNLHYVPGLMILGRTEISSKLEKLQKLLEVNATDEFLRIFLDIRKDIGALLSIRNTLAHGTFLGEMNGGLLFATTATIAPGIPSVAEWKIH